MKSKKIKEEILSRRQFFKSAAKSALPIIGMIVLSNVPQISNAIPTPNGCEADSCYGTCLMGCKGHCGGCDGGCVDMCTGCYNTCRGECTGTCRYSCSGWER